MCVASGFLNWTRSLRFGVLVMCLLFAGQGVFSAPILFLSTQLIPLPEATMMRQVILKDFALSVDFEPYDNRTVFNAQVFAHASHPGGTEVLGGLQEDFLNLYHAGALANVDDILAKLPNRTFGAGVSGRATFGTESTYFVPWMQATYLMAANKRALKYLPKGADLMRLSYGELREWAANMYQATGKGKLGFPVGPNGLMPRFLQGYLYPSFTGSMMDGFSSTAALAMWKYLQDLWPYVAQSSLIVGRMDQALLSEEVWVAWDHSARLLNAFQKKPDTFVAFPAPVGPKGRGIISVLAGLGVPKNSSSHEAAALIEYLTRPRIQIQTLESVGFLPVVDVSGEAGISKGSSALVLAATNQMSSPEALFSSVPILGADGGRDFNLVYLVAFSRIVLQGFDTRAVLDAQRAKLGALNIMVSTPALEIRAR